MSGRSHQEFIRAAVGLICRKMRGGCQILAVHRARYDDWSLPKGKLELGETWQDSAQQLSYPAEWDLVTENWPE